ncbi:MAG: hypothetical protein G01um101429_1123 [Parcubacteria group bacterium Gr01-1014_29]|nr:MAG: hypothetical protein G01um101429_1123 [Parcubacteria group bacterium Gr01-1014_29]
MEKILVYTETDEYKTVRDELLALHAHVRQILYWATGFVIIGMGWYVAQEEPRTIPLWLFTLFLYGVLDISAIAYVVNTIQIYRQGGYLAVFWESHDPEKYRMWHRLNRRGPRGGFLPDAASVIYTTAAIIILVFFLAGVSAHFGRPWEPVGFALVWGLLHIVALSQLSHYLRSQRNQQEIEWRAIKESPERLREIHSRYEMIPAPPPRIIFP